MIVDTLPVSCAMRNAVARGGLAGCGSCTAEYLRSQHNRMRLWRLRDESIAQLWGGHTPTWYVALHARARRCCSNPSRGEPPTPKPTYLELYVLKPYKLHIAPHCRCRLHHLPQV